MPNTREKLIELLVEAEERAVDICIDSRCCEDCPSRKYGINCRKHIQSDHLIANGVTVQKWIPVTERLPENRDDVLVCRTWWDETRNPHIGWYNDVAQEWQILDSDGYYPCGKVTHWMPLPKPPKGE